ncbi:hypothetical protein, partial [Prevotella sp. MGM2]|uniref:hypothetical protein n=1 Tax=Prevotella sp. MGM2 TaxID=2033406 RepID=UPI001CBFF548
WLLQRYDIFRRKANSVKNGSTISTACRVMSKKQGAAPFRPRLKRNALPDEQERRILRKGWRRSALL